MSWLPSILLPGTAFAPSVADCITLANSGNGEGDLAIFDDEPVKPARIHEIGQDLSRLSAGELSERIVQLKAEIARLEAELSTKGASKTAAEAFFRR